MPPRFLTLILISFFALSSSVAFSEEFLADRHAKHGLDCSICHGLNKDEIPSIDQCSLCHNTKQLVAKTRHVKPKNPHISPHYDDKLDCVNCHYGHAKSENFCLQCHNFPFKVP